MDENNDFAVLYMQLGLQPGCNLRELRMAYRRCVARLHPDRNHGDIEALQKLNALYGAALDFQRQMGRLPGAHAVPQTPIQAYRNPASASVNAAASDADRPAVPEPGTRLRTLALLLLILLLSALMWSAINPRFIPADTGDLFIQPFQDFTFATNKAGNITWTTGADTSEQSLSQRTPRPNRMISTV